MLGGNQKVRIYKMKNFENRNALTKETWEINRLRKALNEADAVIIGAGAGLSTAAGHVYDGERFERYFNDFACKYNFHDMYIGGFRMLQNSPEEYWAYFSRNIWVNRYMDAPYPTYSQLLELVKEKDYFVITTNVDHCFQNAGFDKKRLFYTQGDYGLWQCSKPCHQQTYDNQDAIREMKIAQGFSFAQDGKLIRPFVENGKTDYTKLKMQIPSWQIPKCPVCGAPMSTNLRADGTFVEDEGWHEAAQRYDDFIRRHENLNVLFLELGVGYNTPGIIKYPFWKMTAQNPKATYACLNVGEAVAPEEIMKQSILIDHDIKDTIVLLLDEEDLI